MAGSRSGADQGSLYSMKTSQCFLLKHVDVQMEGWDKKKPSKLNNREFVKNWLQYLQRMAIRRTNWTSSWPG